MQENKVDIGNQETKTNQSHYQMDGRGNLSNSLRIINVFSKITQEGDTIDDVVWSVAKNAVAELGYVDCVIYLIDEKGEYLVQRASHGVKNPALRKILNPIRIKIGSGIVGRVATSGKGEIVPDTALDKDYILDDTNRLSEICVPIVFKNKVLGVIDSEHPQRNYFPESDLEILNTIAAMTATKLVQTKYNNELKQKVIETEVATKKAENADALKSAFLANMSHEIRTPLNAILGFASLLEGESDDETKKEKYLSHIHSSGVQLLHVLNDIIDLSKIESNQIELKNEEVSLNDLFEALYSEFNALIQKSKNNKLELILKHGEANGNDVAIFDQLKVKQVMDNLLNNAVKFTRDGTIEFGYSFFKKKEIQFYVKDTGIGLNKNFEEIIFDRFTQDNNHNKYGGAGLGLSICKGLVHLMKGEIKVKRNKGRGSEFHFVIPLVRTVNERGTKIIRRPEQIESVTAYCWENRKILVVEDNPVNAVYIRELLRPSRVNLLEAKNGKEAIQFCKNDNEIDLVLMDIGLPDMSGYDAVREIKLIQKKLPVIAQTAHAMADDKAEALDAGCDGYLSKPLERGEVFDLIAQYI